MVNLLQVFAMLMVGQVVIDAGGEIRRVNKRFCAMVGLSPAAIIGRSVMTFVTAEASETFESDLRHMAIMHEPFVTLSRIRAPNGTELKVRVTGALVPADGCSDRALVHFEVLADTDANYHPDILLKSAQFLMRCESDRGNLFDTALYMTWPAVVAAYIAEASGTAFYVEDFEFSHSRSERLKLRWFQALEQAGIFEREHQSVRLENRTSYRLTAYAQATLEAYLSGIAADGIAALRQTPVHQVS